MKEKISKLLQSLASLERLRFFKSSEEKENPFAPKDDKDEGDKDGPVLEGISFRFKTVQFHIIDDFFEEVKKKQEYFGDVSIYSERFSLPGWGKDTKHYTKDSYQFEIIVRIESKTDKETYINEVEKVVGKIAEKHGCDASMFPTDIYYNVNKVTFFTNTEGVFERKNKMIKNINKYYQEHKQNWKKYRENRKLNHKEEISQYYKKYNKKYNKSHTKEKLAYNKNYRKEHEKEIKQYYIKNKSKIDLQNKNYNRTHKEEIRKRMIKYRKRTFENRKIYNINWRTTHKGLVALSNLKFCHLRKERFKKIGKKEKEDIRKFYINCPKGKEVDHIVPLLGKEIQGWHELKNLQYLTPRENKKKGSKFPYYPLNFYRKKGLI